MQFLGANYAKNYELIQARRIQVKLSIAYQKPEERIAENRRNCTTTGMFFMRALFLPPAHCSSAGPILLHFTLLFFLLQFLVFLLSTLVVITYVWIVWYFTWFVRLHKPFGYTVERRCLAVNKIRAQFSHFSSFLSFSLPFLVAKHPPRMITWRMSS